MQAEQGAVEACKLKLKWFLAKASVALAVAIIKNKPRGIGGREYAEALAGKLGGRDESWKNKAQELQQEVLRLRQEVMLLRLTPNTETGTQNPGPINTEDDLSQDLFDSESLLHNESLQLNCDSETPELFMQDPQPANASPTEALPPSLAMPKENVMHPTVQFLQSLCALHRAGGSNKGLEALWFSPDGYAGSVLVDSVCQLLDSVVTACRDPPPLGPHDLVLQACGVAAQAMDLFCSQRLPSVEFKKHMEASLRELTAMLLHRNHPSRLQAADKLMEYLITLGSSSMTQSFLIGHILSQISDMADRLWQVFQGQESSVLERFPVDQYQNSFYLFSVLEELLQKSKVPYRLEVEAEQMGFRSHLEQRVFVLSDEFPLFSVCMWRIGCLFTWDPSTCR